MNEQLDLFLNDASAHHVPTAQRDHADRTQLLAETRQESDRTLLTRQLEQELQSRSGLAIGLTITDNVSTMMFVRHLSGGNLARVRLHHMFLTAPKEVLKALAHWIKHPRSKKYAALFKAFIVARNDEIRSAAARERRPVTRGRQYELREIYEELNRQYFDNAVDVAITWGRDSGRNTRSIRFGGYYPNEGLIRIHPRLDQPFVPPYFIRYIVYHEMLHAHLGIEQSEGGRRSIHPRIFKQREQVFSEYAQAIAWIEDSANLRRVLRRSRCGPASVL